MARIEKMNFLGETRDCVNISRTVGNGRANEKDDVMLIQALLRFIGLQEDPDASGEYDNFAKYSLGLNSAAEVPRITGIFDSLTANAIRVLQNRHIHRVLKVDGIVHPASYHYRHLKKQYPLMTITLLDLEASETITNIGNGHYIQGLKMLAPALPF